MSSISGAPSASYTNGAASPPATRPQRLTSASPPPPETAPPDVPALVPLDPSWFKPHPLLDGALDEALEPTRDRSYCGPGESTGARLDDPLEWNGDPRTAPVAIPVPVARGKAMSPPPGFGALSASPPLGRSASPKMGLTEGASRYARGPGVGSGFTSRIEARKKLADKQTADPPVNGHGRDAEPKDPSSRTQKKNTVPWKNEIDRMFLVDDGLLERPTPSTGISMADMERKMINWNVAEPDQKTMPSQLRIGGSSASEEQASAEVGNEWSSFALETGKFDEKAADKRGSGLPGSPDEDGELAPNVLSFFNAVKAQAVVGVSTRPSQENPRTSPGPAVLPTARYQNSPPPAQPSQRSPPPHPAHPPVHAIPASHPGLVPPSMVSQPVQVGGGQTVPLQRHAMPMTHPGRYGPPMSMPPGPPPPSYYGHPVPPPPRGPPEFEVVPGAAPSFSADEFFQFFQNSASNIVRGAPPSSVNVAHTAAGMNSMGTSQPGHRGQGLIPPPGMPGDARGPGSRMNPPRGAMRGGAFPGSTLPGSVLQQNGVVPHPQPPGGIPPFNSRTT